MRVSRATALHLLLICLAVLLIITPGSAWWFDDFTSDTSADYTGTNFAANFYWNTAKSNLSAGPYTGAYDSHQIYYNGEQYTKGNFTYKFAVNTSGANTYRPSVNFGAADVYTATEIYGQSSCKGTETKYTSYLTGDLGGNPRYYLTQCIAGAPTDLDTADIDAAWIRDDNSIFYFIVNWDPTGLPSPQFPPGDTINITLWKEGSGDMNYLSSNDATITTGYSGMGSKYWQVFYSWDWVNFQALGTPATPTPTPTPTPTEGPVVPVELGHFNANLTANITHLHREDVYHPVEIPLWFWATIMGAGIGALLFSLVWRGAVNVTVISGWVAFLLVEVAQWTAFMIRDTTVISSVVNSTATDALNLSVWVAYQPVTVATDWIVPFWGAFPFTILAIMNVMALGMELGWPGLRHLKPGIFRR